jgi:hypothetical protein
LLAYLSQQHVPHAIATSGYRQVARVSKMACAGLTKSSFVS